MSYKHQQAGETKIQCNYKQLIINMINQMENENFLWKIYSFIRVFYLKEMFPERDINDIAKNGDRKGANNGHE